MNSEVNTSSMYQNNQPMKTWKRKEQKDKWGQASVKGSIKQNLYNLRGAPPSKWGSIIFYWQLFERFVFIIHLWYAFGSATIFSSMNNIARLFWFSTWNQNKKNLACLFVSENLNLLMLVLAIWGKIISNKEKYVAIVQRSERSMHRQKWRNAPCLRSMIHSCVLWIKDHFGSFYWICILRSYQRLQPTSITIRKLLYKSK